MVSSYIGVCTIAGAIAFTRILRGINSNAAAFTNVFTAALEAEYTAIPLSPHRDAEEDIAKIDAPSFVYLLLEAKRHTSAKTSTFKLNSRFVSSIWLTRNGAFIVIPAQCTTPSIFKPFVLQKSNNFCTFSKSVRSAS